MRAQRYGRRAVWLSVLVHCLLLAGLGWLSPLTPQDSPEKDYVELELVSENSGSLGSSSVLVPSGIPNPSSQNLQQVDPANPATAAASQAADAAVGSVQAVVSNAIVDVQGTSDGAAGVSSASDDRSGNSSAGNGGTETNASADQPAGVILPPHIIYKVNPTYPDQARRQGLEGKVTVKIEVLADGLPGDVVIVHSSGSSLLDESVVAAVEQWRFAPAKNSATQQSMACLTTVSLVFKLNPA
jgi:protein TonB